MHTAVSESDLDHLANGYDREYGDLTESLSRFSKPIQRE
jgi:hypothetical protein